MKGLAHTLCVALLVAVTLVACRRDDGEATLTLTDESFDGGKMSVAGVAATWTQGDKVWVNGSVYTIGVGNNGQASTTVVSAATYNALFPASVAVNSSTVRLPKDYQYATDGQGRQMLDLPMMASSDGTTLFFRHITAALVVSVANHRSETLTLDRVTVRSNSYAISGERSIDFADYGQSPIVAATADDKEVNIYFDRQGVVLNSGDSICVMLPVAPVGADNQFTVEVSTHREGYRYLATRTQENGHSFARNALGYAFMKVDNNITDSPIFEVYGDYFLINSTADFKLFLNALSNHWTRPGGYEYNVNRYRITSDIDMSDTTIAPISGFSGASFDGQGHTISNLTINSTGVCCALFDTIKSGTTISNITLANVTLNSNGAASERKISPLIGHLSGDHSFNNCIVNGTSVTINGDPSGDIYFGGFAAAVAGSNSFTNCHFNGDVTLNSNGKLYYGGILGALIPEKNATLSVNLCSNNDTIHANLTAVGFIYAGGIIGDAQRLSNTITNQTSLINFKISTPRRFFVGGLVGYLLTTTTTLSINNDIIAGVINILETPSTTSYIGTLYGKGKNYGQYGLNVNTNYDASGLSIFTNNNSNIQTGNPSYQ